MAFMRIDGRILRLAGVAVILATVLGGVWFGLLAREQAQLQAGALRPEQAAALHASTVQMGLGALLATTMLAALAVWFHLRSITRPIGHSIQVLSAGALGVASASRQVNAASQSLAEGATEQAAALADASSALEQMAAMTARNAEHCKNAKQFADQTSAAADAGSRDMSDLAAAVDAIQASSTDISNIIKIIDEIAFQTNLLALNAAVEAARAGEAGAGFAVVAGEVRNLARRSAEAAKDIAARIESSASKTGEGVWLTTKVGQSLQEMVEKARKVNDLISEIARASDEQSQGVQKLNQTVARVDQITQRNASTAEESASAASELHSQADSLNRAVAELTAVVGQGRETAILPPATPPKPLKKPPVRETKPAEQDFVQSF
jgi:methyl-accepting chemotaxis protein